MWKQILLIAAFGQAGAAWAQSTEATRYVNGQGIEMIQNRQPPVPASIAPVAPQDAAHGKKAAVVSPPALRVSPAGAVVSPAARDTSFKVSPDDQQARDRDRVNILRQELMKELGDYETKNKVLRNPAMKAGLDEQQLKRMQETLQAHERNIRDLNAEITRAVRQ